VELFVQSLASAELLFENIKNANPNKRDNVTDNTDFFFIIIEILKIKNNKYSLNLPPPF